MDPFGKYWVRLACILTIVFYSSGLAVYAAEDRDCGHLIQTTTFKEEYEGMVRYGGTVAVPTKKADVEEAYERVRKGIVKINTEGLYGSGVIWEMNEEEIIIISNRHLLENWNNRSFVTFAGGRAVPGTILMLSDIYDLGFLSVDIEEFGYDELVQLRAVDKQDRAYEEMKEGSPVFIAGSADGVGENMYEGIYASGWWYVEEFDSYMILSFCYGRPGMSGGGTFDPCGNFIGMLSGGTGGDEVVSLPVTVIIEEYERWIASEVQER